MGRVKEFFGVEPKLEEEEHQVYSPSKTVLKTIVKSRTDYDKATYSNAYKAGDKKILIIATEQEHLKMDNGKIFLTGNHPVEFFVPMLHWQSAGFKFDIATINGKSVKLEHWAMPVEDQDVLGIYQGYKDKLTTPLSLKDIANNLEEANYFAVFIPGGHGAVIDLPFSVEVKKVLTWAVQNNKYIVSICHGPAAFIAAALGEDKNNFLFKDSQIVAFPDGSDKILPSLGYLPGKMPWFFGKELEELGVEIVNKIAIGKVYQDLKIITGDSPLASNELGRVAAELFLEEVNSY